ncbi:hypothetical protein COMNV_01666 [Commensalibacter sp. Nvir]|uniref:hypothetical protein n=1 Tax=Commensalibacter sp. Nvir TaxID=3069817 RepID=UPI002D704DE4|nr:hypothetical protein COMNV_01666 [Commensalibacter sp. Nvir]
MEEPTLNTKLDLNFVLAVCPQALQMYEQRGLDDVVAAYDIGNVLSTNRFYAEAAYLYKLAFEMHSKSPSEYPLAHILWMIRIVALLKGGLEIKDEELEQLKNLSVPFYNYITGWKAYKENKGVRAALKIMENCYEEFPTGEEADRVYLSLMVELLNNKFVGDGESRNSNVSGFNAIPNNVFMYWDENPPEEIQANFSYHQSMTHFNLKIFNKNEAANWLYHYYGVEARQLFLNVRHPAEGADFFRLHVINHYGGWWLDADIKIRSIKRFFEIIPVGYDHVFFVTDEFVAHNDFFGSIANSPILNEGLRSLYHNSYVHKDMFIAYKTGPGILNRALNRNFYRFYKGEAKAQSCIILDHNDFWKVIEDFPTPYKEISPHWMAS